MVDMDGGRRRPVKIEMFYTLMCPSCKSLKKILKEVLPEFGDQFIYSKTLANGPMGIIRSMKLGIHAVPALLIDDRIVFRSVPSKSELISELNKYLKNGE